MTAKRPPLFIQKQRPALAAELAQIAWLSALTAQEYAIFAPQVRVAYIKAGEIICSIGKPVRNWFGVIDGLLKMMSDSVQGLPTSLIGIPSGGWFGEGTALKREAYRYSICALRNSLVAGITVEEFHQLLNTSIGFNRFVMNQLNERVSHLIAAKEVDRLCCPEYRVARTLLGLLNPYFYPDKCDKISITQGELANLVGLSRQRVNIALQAMAKLNIVNIEYGNIEVLNRKSLSQNFLEKHSD